MWLLVCASLLLMALIFFGWRAMASIAIVVAMSLLTYLLSGLVIHMIQPQRKSDSLMHVATMSLLLGLCLPVMRQPSLVVLAGALMGFVMHLTGRVHRLRIHPVAMTMVLVWLLPVMLVRSMRPGESFPMFDTVNTVLRPDHLVRGDLFKFSDEISRLPWSAAMRDSEWDAVRRMEPYALLIDGQTRMLQPTMLVNMLASGELPRVEELLLGVTPGAVGASSRGLLILLGLYLMYRRVSWWPVGLSAFMAAFVTLLVMPVFEHSQQTIVGMRLAHLGPAVAVTYIGYMLLGSPLALIALILAPTTAPMSAWGRVIYGILIGMLLILAQWFLRTPQAAYVSLLIASAMSRPLDALQSSAFVRYADRKMDDE